MLLLRHRSHPDVVRPKTRHPPGARSGPPRLTRAGVRSGRRALWPGQPPATVTEPILVLATMTWPDDAACGTLTVTAPRLALAVTA